VADVDRHGRRDDRDAREAAPTADALGGSGRRCGIRFGEKHPGENTQQGRRAVPGVRDDRRDETAFAPTPCPPVEPRVIDTGCTVQGQGCLGRAGTGLLAISHSDSLACRYSSGGIHGSSSVLASPSPARFMWRSWVLLSTFLTMKTSSRNPAMIPTKMNPA